MNDILGVYNEVNSLFTIKDTGISKVVLKASKELYKKIEWLQSAQQLPKSKEVVAYRQAISEEFYKHARKDKKGDVVIIKGQPQLDPDKEKEWIEGEKKISKLHPVAVKELEQHNKGIHELMNKDVEVKFRGISEDILPKDLTANQLSVLYKYFIDDNEESI